MRVWIVALDTSDCVTYDDDLGMVVGKAASTEKDQKSSYEKTVISTHTATNRSSRSVGRSTDQAARLGLLSVTLDRRKTSTITET